jgi:hypothetical protein
MSRVIPRSRLHLDRPKRHSCESNVGPADMDATTPSPACRNFRTKRSHLGCASAGLSPVSIEGVNPACRRSSDPIRNCPSARSERVPHSSDGWRTLRTSYCQDVCSVRSPTRRSSSRLSRSKSCEGRPMERAPRGWPVFSISWSTRFTSTSKMRSCVWVLPTRWQLLNAQPV